MEKFVYFFGGGKAEGHGQMKDELGGKGAGLAEMTNAGLPVPPGFTISTSACRQFMEQNGKVSAEVDQQMNEALERLEKLAGQKLGDEQALLLVSVRAPVSCFTASKIASNSLLGISSTTLPNI